MNNTNSSAPFVVKVRFEGETKRVKLDPKLRMFLFDQLVQKTCGCFEGKSNFLWTLEQPLSFYYLDDENEIISLTSEQDLQEAIKMDAFAKMKFVVARNTEAARKEFCSQLDESNSISQKDAFSDFEKVSARDLVEDIYKPAFDLKFGNRLEQNQ